MASEVKTNKISPATSTTINVGDSGDTLALAVDDVTGFNVGSDAAGDVLYNDGTDYTRLAKPGTPADEVLTFATGASAPSWASADKIIKGWVCFGGASAAIKDSFNVSSITDSGVGSYVVVWDTDFSNANYAVVCGGDASAGGYDYIQSQNSAEAVGSVNVYAYTGAGGATFDPAYVSIVAIGDQA